VTTLDKIKEDIVSLPYKDKVALAKWFSLIDGEIWDKQIEEDFRDGGKGHILLDKIKDDFDQGKCKKWN